MSDTPKPPVVNVTQVHKGCGSGCGTGCASIIVILIGASVISTWLTKKEPSTATPSKTEVSEPTATAHTPAPSTKPTTPAAQFSTADEAQRVATSRYPELGVAGSKLNMEFVARYKRYKQEKPEFFRDTSWPIHLAEESVQAINSK